MIGQEMSYFISTHVPFLYDFVLGASGLEVLKKIMLS